MKIVACLALALLVAGCIPIGARVPNMYTQAGAAARELTAAAAGGRSAARSVRR